MTALRKVGDAPSVRVVIAALPLIALVGFLWAVVTGHVSPEWALAADGNRYAANIVLAVATVCSQLVVFVNLSFYLMDTRPARARQRAGVGVPTVLPEGEVGQGLYWALSLCWFGIGAYFLYALMTLLGMGRAGYRLFYLDTFFVAARLVTIGMFVVFALIDGALARAWRRVAEQGGDAGAAKSSRDLALSSVWLIDVPAIAVTASSWLVVHALSGSEFLSKVAEADYGSGRVWVALRSEQVELFVNGIDTGVVVATMLLSQITFAWLMWKFQTGARSATTS